MSVRTEHPAASTDFHAKCPKTSRIPPTSSATSKGTVCITQILMSFYFQAVNSFNLKGCAGGNVHSFSHTNNATILLLLLLHEHDICRHFLPYNLCLIRDKSVLSKVQKTPFPMETLVRTGLLSSLPRFSPSFPSFFKKKKNTC